MSNAFRNNPFNVLQSPIKPEDAYTPPSSPTKNSPSKAAARYSPAVSFRRDSNNFMDSSIGRKFVQRADESPLRSSITPRKLFTESESPRKPTAAVTSGLVNPFISEEPEDEVLGNIPMLNPSVSSIELSMPKQQVTSFRVSSLESGSTIASSMNSKRIKSDNSSYFSSDQSTINASIANEKMENEDEFGDSTMSNELDQNLMNRAPLIQPRRNKHQETQTVFKSIKGNLTLDTPVPKLLHEELPIKGTEEFDYMTYSAVTSDPDNFVNDGFYLRQTGSSRATEIVVCITMYNEDEIALTRTLHAVFQNIAYLNNKTNSSAWGKDSWKKVVVCIVSDGRNKVKPGVLEVLGTMGVYQEGISKSLVNKKDVQAHLFEYTAQVSIDENLNIKGGKNVCPVQIIFCMKEKNAKKINSHRWLFNAVCPVLNPNVCVLLDVGTRPNETAVYNLWKAFDVDSNVAGAAGEIVAMKGKYWSKLVNPLVASQNFEYKMSNILDKPCESAFGYISVLPGALSAYRYEALQNHADGTGPLHAYFKGESQDSADMANIFSANMYLAEDRILAWELVAKREAQWVLKYVKDAKGETDVPETLSEFVLQRRRWLNGAFFAALYSLKQSSQILRTDHSAIRKFFFYVEFFYQAATLLFSFFSISNFYITFYYLAGSLITIGGTGGKVFFEIMNYVCLCTLLAMLVISMGNKPTGAPMLFWICVILLTICGLYAIISGFYFLSLMIKDHSAGSASGLNFASICVSLASTYGLYTLMSILYLDPWHIISSSVQYFLLLPAYTCLLQIYAFCNTHDVSWGTKGDTEVAKPLGSATVEQDGQNFYIRTGILEQQDIDSMYAEMVIKMRERRKKPLEMRDKTSKDGKKEKNEVSKEDYYRDVRSRVVLFWVISNVILVMTITQIWKPDAIKSNKYLAFILWSVFGFSCFRFLGSFAYLVHLVIRRIVITKNKWDIKKEQRVPQMRN